MEAKKLINILNRWPIPITVTAAYRKILSKEALRNGEPTRTEKITAALNDFSLPRNKKIVALTYTSPEENIFKLGDSPAFTIKKTGELYKKWLKEGLNIYKKNTVIDTTIILAENFIKETSTSVSVTANMFLDTSLLSIPGMELVKAPETHPLKGFLGFPNWCMYINALKQVYEEKDELLSEISCFGLYILSTFPRMINIDPQITRAIGHRNVENYTFLYNILRLFNPFTLKDNLPKYIGETNKDKLAADIKIISADNYSRIMAALNLNNALNYAPLTTFPLLHDLHKSGRGEVFIPEEKMIEAENKIIELGNLKGCQANIITKKETSESFLLDLSSIKEGTEFIPLFRLSLLVHRSMPTIIRFIKDGIIPPDAYKETIHKNRKRGYLIRVSHIHQIWNILKSHYSKYPDNMPEQFKIKKRVNSLDEIQKELDRFKKDGVAILTIKQMARLLGRSYFFIYTHMKEVPPEMLKHFGESKTTFKIEFLPRIFEILMGKK